MHVKSDGQDNVKKPVIPYLRKRAHSTARIAARWQMLQFGSQPTHLHNVARREIPVKVPYICKINILVVTVHSFTLLISQEVSLSGAAQSSNSSALCSDNAPDSSECEPPSDFSATSTSDFHHRSMLSMLQTLGPALDQVKA